MKQSPETIAKRVASRRRNALIKGRLKAERAARKAAKKAITINGGKHPLAPKELPVVMLSNSHEDAIQFATFMATAWKMFRE